MEWKIVEAKGYDYLEMKINAGDEVYAQLGSYLMHIGDVQIESKAYGGIGSALKRAFLGGESFFLNRITTQSQGYVYLAPYLPGEIKHMTISNPLYVRDASYFASYGALNITSKFIGLRGFFTSGGFFWLYVEGQGDLWLNSYGSLVEIGLKAGEEITVDNGNLVAYESSLKIETKKLGSMKTFLFGGEGLVFKMTGPGKVYLQTRNLYQFIASMLGRLHK